jgi:hypothetical protein
VQILHAIVVGLARECPDQLDSAQPFLQPQTLLFGRTHIPLRVSIALRVIVAGEGLINHQGCTGPREHLRGGLAPEELANGVQIYPLILYNRSFRNLVLRAKVSHYIFSNTQFSSLPI